MYIARFTINLSAEKVSAESEQTHTLSLSRNTVTHSLISKFLNERPTKQFMAFMSTLKD